MYRLATNVLCALAIMATNSQVTAHELGDFGQYLRGVTIGDPMALVLPPGFYFENTTAFAPHLPGHGQFQATTVDGFVDVPSLVWSTGWTFLGANVSMFLSQPGYILTAWNSATTGPPFPDATFYREISNTWVSPLELSRNIGGNWFAGVGFAVHIPDGTRFNNTTNPDYWTYEPHAALTYFSKEWNFTANLTYDFNTASDGHTGVFADTPLAAVGRGYLSGDQIFLELAGTGKFGKWEIGPVAYFMWQTNSDRPGAGFSCSSLAATTQLLITCGRATDYAIGGLVGYDFGPAALKLYLTDSIYTRDNVGGMAFWSKLSFKIGE